MQERGNIGANASLAEISAYKGQWLDVLQYAQAVVKAPSSVRTMNVYDDMIHLVALSGVQTGNWVEIQRLADFVTKLGEANVPICVEPARNLAELAASSGQDTSVWRRGGLYNDPEVVRIAQFEAALNKLSKAGKKRFKTPEERRNHFFSLAEVYVYYQGAVTLYDQDGLPDLLFDSVAFTASALARCGRTEEAWRDPIKGPLMVACGGDSDCPY